MTLPSRLAPGIGARLGDAHAGVIRTGAFLLAERRELMLLNRTVRASGRRVLLGFPFGRASEAGSDRELALLGMHLASGGGLWVEGGARLPDRLERARAALRRRPELVHRSDARVGVLVDPGELEASALVELTGTLEAVRIPWDVVLQPTEAGWPDQHEGERVSAYAALALPRAALLSEELVGLLAGASSPRWILLRPSDPAAPAARERLDAAGIPHVTVGKGMSGVVSLPEELGWVITDLPAPVWVGRTKAPHRGLVVHHFVNRARDRRGRSVPVAASTLELPAGGAGAGGRCEAEWLVPDEDLQQAVPCRVGPHGRFAVDLPAFATWAVLTVRARPFDRSASFGEAPLRLAETTEGWDGGTLQLMVPFWPPGQVLSLSLPEEFGGGVAHVLEGMDSAVEQWSPRGARFVSSSPDLQIIRELRTGLDSVDVTLTLENLGDEPIPEVSAVVCLASDGVTVVPDSGHDTTYFVDQNHTLTLLAGVPTDSGDPLFREHRGHSLPLTIVESVDGRWAMASGFEGGRGVGGNGNRAGVCVHSRPFFGVLEPGVPKSLRGTFYVTQDEPAAIVRRWTAAHGEPERYPGGDDRWRGPCE